MKKLFVLLTLASATASFAHADIACELITRKTILECLNSGTDKNKLLEDIIQLRKDEKITEEAFEDYKKAIAEYSAE